MRLRKNHFRGSEFELNKNQQQFLSWSTGGAGNQVWFRLSLHRSRIREVCRQAGGRRSFLLVLLAGDHVALRHVERRRVTVGVRRVLEQDGVVVLRLHTNTAGQSGYVPVRCTETLVFRPRLSFERLTVRGRSHTHAVNTKESLRDDASL